MRGKKYATNIHLQAKIKGSEYRRFMATALKIWKNPKQGNFKVSKTAEIMSRGKPSILAALSQSNFYLKHPKRIKSNKNSFEKQMKIKNSDLRKKITLCLKTWRMFFSLKDGAKHLNMELSYYGKFLMMSKAYRNQKKYSYKDGTTALRWAKKTLAINMLGGSCQKCGNSNIFALDFHHEESKENENSICRMISGGITWEDTKKEVEKCILLCRNCHQQHHIDTNRIKRLNLLIQQKMKQIELNKFGGDKKRRKSESDKFIK